MEQHHVPVLNLVHNTAAHGGGVLGGPVPGIHRPVQNGQPGDLCHLPDSVAAAASRRPEPDCLAALRQQRPGIRQLLGDVPAAEGFHIFVGVAVDADLMALVEDPLGVLGVFGDPVAAEKEGGFGIPLFQAVQQPPGIAA